MNRSIHSLLGAIASVVITTASADEVTDQIALGTQAYEAGELRQAVQELQYAIAQIQERLNNDYTKLMPAPLPGWSADEAQAQSGGMSMMGGGTQVTRSYTRDGSEESVQIQLMADSPFLQAMSMMLSNPMIMNSDPATKMYRHGRYRGMLRHQPGSEKWEFSLMVANRVLVQVTGDGLKSQESAESYLKALDLSAVETAFSQ